MIGLVAGWLAARRLAPGVPAASLAALSLGLGLGLLSLVSYLWLATGPSSIYALLVLEGALVVAALLLPRGLEEAGESAAPAPAPRHLVAVAALAALAALLAALHTLQRFPFGGWDAVDIWNYRALMFTRSGLEAAFGEVDHPDYPLLLPLVVSYGWRFVGEATGLSWSVGISLAVASVGLLYGETAWRRGRAAAWVATALLLATPFYAVQAASQRADVPLSFFALAATSVLVRYERHPRASLLLVAGGLLGCAAWTKNEGIAFAAALVVAWLSGAPRRRLSQLWRLAAGALPFAAALLHHKLTCGEATDLIAGQGAETWARLGDLSRWAMVAGAFARDSAFFAAAAVGLHLAFRWVPFPARKATNAGDLRFVWLAVGFMLALDFAVYLTTPYDLSWHLQSSLERVLLQLWPTALFAVAIAAPPPWRRCIPA